MTSLCSICFQEADYTLNFDQQILEAATSITTAVAALVKAASAAQRELVTQGRVSFFVRIRYGILYYTFICFRSRRLLVSNRTIINGRKA